MIFNYFLPDGKLQISILARSQEHASILHTFAFSGTSLTYEEWCIENTINWIFEKYDDVMRTL